MGIRVYKLAKLLNFSSKELIAILTQLKVEVKGHMSVLDEETAELVRHEIESRGLKEVLPRWNARSGGNGSFGQR